MRAEVMRNGTVMKTLARSWVIGVFALAIFVGAGAAWAAEDGKVFQDWTVRCDQNPSNAAAGGCYILQNVVNSETQQPVMQIAIGLLKTDNSTVTVITLPLGILLPPGITLQIDQRQPARIPIQRCMPDGCKVQFRMSPEQISVFKGGIGGQLTFQDAVGRQVPVPFSLKGFTAALSSLGS